MLVLQVYATRGSPHRVRVSSTTNNFAVTVHDNQASGLSITHHHIQPELQSKTSSCPVNSRCSGHPRDRHLVSVIARVRNSGVR